MAIEIADYIVGESKASGQAAPRLSIDVRCIGFTKRELRQCLIEELRARGVRFSNDAMA